RLDGYFEPAEFFGRAPDATAAERALAARLWPGPVGILYADGPFAAWGPAHAVAGAVLAARPAPAPVIEAYRGGLVAAASLRRPAPALWRWSSRTAGPGLARSRDCG